MNDLTLLDLVLDGFHLLPSLLTGTLHDLGDPTRADLDCMKVTQSCFRTDIAHVEEALE